MKYQPHEYQAYATRFILEHPVAAVFLQMGLGKSVITLTAIHDLIFDRFEIRRVLVIAPLRVARDTWPAEIEKWDHLKGLTYSVVVGDEHARNAALMKDVQIYIINRENVSWLVEDSAAPFDYDMIVIDELSSFKSWQAKRFKSLLKVRPRVGRIVGLTGTPSSNGLMDLFAEFRVLDMGQRLGRFITRYRETFFRPDRTNGMQVYSWKPLPSAEEEIYRRIGDVTISMKSIDFLEMPECLMNRVPVRMDFLEKDLYDEMKQDLVIQLKGRQIDAKNATALSGKLTQMANGAVYTEEGEAVHIHDRKLDALEDLIGATKKWERIESYGPKFVENIVQAISRDILCYAMRTLSHCFICGHIHDELIIEASMGVDLKAVCEQMGRVPLWLPGAVLRADGYETEWYRKD